MGLLSKNKASSPAKSAPSDLRAADPQEVVREARTRARRRLIGAALLLGVGIIAFPLLFETQPRPIAVDIPIEIPSREQVAPLVPAGTRPVRRAPEAVAPPPIEAPASMVTAAAPADPAVTGETGTPPASRLPTRPVSPPEAKADTPPAPKVEHKAEPKAEKPEPRPEAKPAAKPAEAPHKASDAAKDDGRYVVQIGAFAEAGSAREARMKVEALGLKTYTQVIESSTGRRIRVRVGPYGSKAEAEKAAKRIKAGGLPAAVLVL